MAACTSPSAARKCVRPTPEQVEAAFRVLAAAIAAPPAPSADDLLVEVDVAQIAATSVRVVRAARRRGELAAYGGQRDRSYRRRDVERWIESRRAPIHSAIDDADMDARIERLQRRAANGGAR